MRDGLQARIVVRVQPGARENRVLGFKDGVCQIRIAAPPVGGKANEELTKLLGEILGLRQSDLSIEKGMSSKTKVVGIARLTRDQVVERLERVKRT